jgi:phosphate transport system substrate-binding protein
MMRLKSYAAAASLAAAFSVNSAFAAEVSGAGATFPEPIYAKWIEVYKAETGVSLRYQAIGSGGGIKQIEAKTVTFGATDKPLDDKELDAHGLIQFPTVIGGIVPVINIAGVKSGELALNGPTLAKIFLGEITAWDDPAIKALNPQLKLPGEAIIVVHRSDGSGTTFNFTNYLSKVSETWNSKIGFEVTIEWPVGVGAKGNKGVAGEVADTDGAIGYVEHAYARQQKLTFVKMINKDGKAVAPEVKSFQAAAANADWAALHFGVVLTDQPGEASWPITAATFILMHQTPADPEASKQALAFFDWAYTRGDQMATELGYIPLPDSVVELVHEEWKSIKDSAGKPLCAMN